MTLGYTTLQGTKISPCKGTLQNDFPFPQVGYVSFLEGIVETSQAYDIQKVKLFRKKKSP